MEYLSIVKFEDNPLADYWVVCSARIIKIYYFFDPSRIPYHWRMKIDVGDGVTAEIGRVDTDEKEEVIHALSEREPPEWTDWSARCT